MVVVGCRLCQRYIDAAVVASPPWVRWSALVLLKQRFKLLQTKTVIKLLIDSAIQFHRISQQIFVDEKLQLTALQGQLFRSNISLRIAPPSYRTPTKENPADNCPDLVGTNQ
jgi:hypothetical protein